MALDFDQIDPGGPTGRKVAGSQADQRQQADGQQGDWCRKDGIGQKFQGAFFCWWNVVQLRRAVRW